MSGYIQSLRERVEPDPAEPMVLDLDNEDTGEILGALSSETAREIVLALHEQPATLSEVAEHVDTSRQNAQYHLQKLEAVDAVRVVDILYSEKGREMKLYAPSGEPLIIVSSEDDTGNKLRESISGLMGPAIAIGLVSLAVQVTAEIWFGQQQTGSVNNDFDAPLVESTYAADPAFAGEALWVSYPGLMLFLSALAALLLVAVWRYHRRPLA